MPKTFYIPGVPPTLDLDGNTTHCHDQKSADPAQRKVCMDFFAKKAQNETITLDQRRFALQAYDEDCAQEESETSYCVIS